MHAMSRILWLFALWVLLAAGVFPLFAQDVEPIAAGDTVSGKITSDAPVAAYTFEGTEGEIIGIDVLSTDDQLDPFVELVGVDGEVIAANDDSAGTRDARLGPINLPAAGAYTIRVRSCCPPNPYSIGGFELTLKDVSVTMLAVDSPVTINISADDPEQYLEVDGATVDPGYYLILAETDDSISYFLDVYNPDGSYITGDNAFEGETFIVEPLRFDEDAFYPIDLIFEDEQGAGSITLTLEAVATDPLETNTTIEDTLTEDEPSHFYAFQGDAATQYRVLAEQLGDTPFEIIVFDTEGGRLLGDNTNDGAIDLFPVQVSVAGEYLVVVQRIVNEGDMASEVAYDLTLEATPITPLALDEPVSAALAQETRVQIFGYEGSAGESLTITLTADDDVFGLGMDVVSDTTGERVVTMVSPLPGSVSYTVTLPDDGLYTFYVFNGDFGEGIGTGAFNLTLAGAE